MTQYPGDDVLLARGKYATLGSHKRDAMKRLQEHMENVTAQARHILRFDEDAAVAMSFYEAMQGRITDTGAVLADLATLQAELDELKPLAWGKEKR